MFSFGMGLELYEDGAYQWIIHMTSNDDTNVYFHYNSG
jgi:hypothetical protein